MERLDKILSNLGIISRSECKKAIKQGLVKVNGVTADKPDIKVDPDRDVIAFNGSEIHSASKVYYMLNKPAGYITATEDKMSPVVLDLISDTRTDLSAVGRLDKDTTGILLITNDGALGHRLLSPRHHVPKRYEVLIDGQLDPEAVKLLSEGMDIGDDSPTLPAKVEILSEEPPQQVALTITEGRYHQVKRMFAKVGCPVLKLHRSDFGPLKLDAALAPGEYRELAKDELDSLLKL